MDEFFSWQMLASLSGCALATGILTQFLKNTFSKLPTQWLSYLIAVITLFAAAFFTGGLTWSAAALIPMNAVLVALSANGAYSACVRMKNGKPTAGQDQ